MTTTWYLSKTALLNLSRADLIEIRNREDGRWEVRAIWGYRGENLRVCDTEEEAQHFLKLIYQGLISSFCRGLSYDD